MDGYTSKCQVQRSSRSYVLYNKVNEACIPLKKYVTRPQHQFRECMHIKKGFPSSGSNEQESLNICVDRYKEPKGKHKNKRRTRGKKTRSERGTEKRKTWTRRNEEIMRRRRKPPRKAYFSFCFPHNRKICDLRRGKTKALTGSSGQLCACSYFSPADFFSRFDMLLIRFWDVAKSGQYIQLKSIHSLRISYLHRY